MTWTCVGVPRNASMKLNTPGSTTVDTAPPIDPESSTIRVTGPPQRDFARTNDGTVKSSGAMSLVSTPPAVRLTELVPPAVSPPVAPPLIVTTIRWALAASARSAGSSSSGVDRIQVGRSVSGLYVPGLGGAASSWSTTTFVHGSPPMHSIRCSCHSPVLFWMYWYCTWVSTGVPSLAAVNHASCRALAPDRSSEPQFPHGLASAAVLTGSRPA